MKTTKFPVPDVNITAYDLLRSADTITEFLTIARVLKHALCYQQNYFPAAQIRDIEHNIESEIVPCALYNKSTNPRNKSKNSAFIIVKQKQSGEKSFFV